MVNYNNSTQVGKENIYLLCLFLEGIQDAINKLLLQTGIHIRWPKVSHGLQQKNYCC